MKTSYSIIASVIETDDKGKTKTKKRNYIVSINSDSCTAAEEFIKQEVGSQIQEVLSLKKVEVDMFLSLESAGETYYSAKVTYLVESDDTGKIKRRNTVSYVLASDISEVREQVLEQIKNQVHEAFISSISKTKIKEIILEN